MPDIDLRTIIFMSMLLTFMLSMLLAITRAHHKTLSGPGYWAVGNLVVGLGMILVLMQLDSARFVLLPGTALIGTGLSLYINGIQAFSGSKPDHRIPIIAFFLLITIDILFLLIAEDIRTAVVLGALAFAVIYMICARLTFIKEEGVQGHLYWLVSGLFFFLGLLMIGRAISAANAEIAVFDSFATWPLNAYTFMVGAVSQFFISSLFVLMLSGRLNRSLETMVTVDSLTNILNRRGLDEASLKMSGICKRINMSMAVLLIDIDHFKKVNDQYGHLAGDEVLRHVSSVVKDLLRSGDVFGRYGGEEFAVFMPNTNENEAVKLAERLRIAIGKTPFKNDQLIISVTVSIGVTDSVRAGYGFEGLVAAADAALYEAKESGRNRVMRSFDVA